MKIMKTQLLSSALLALLCALAACTPRDESAGEIHDEHEEADHDFERGPHNGRLLRDGNVTVELAIYEQGVPPEFRAWILRDGKAVAPAANQLQVRLTRLGGVVNTHELQPQGDFLRGAAEVYEPHSFDVEVTLTSGSEQHRWTYASYEGRTTIAAAIGQEAGLVTARVEGGTIRDEHDVQGLLTTIEGRHAHVKARFPGPVREVTVAVGDTVRAGQKLAVIESNLSLSTYDVVAPLAGTVLARDVSLGDLADGQQLFEIADLSRLWVDLHLFGRDAQHITPGLPVEVFRLSDGVSTAARLDRILPGTATASQSTVARATLVNGDGLWRPGAAVRARVTVAETPVAMRIPVAALQRFRDSDVAFVRVGDVYEARPLELGERDARWVEVKSGLTIGDEIVVEQSYLVKADIEKSGAVHDH
jgi:cobalt-zinc-cadmium efflux system membrane fusion protein